MVRICTRGNCWPAADAFIVAGNDAGIAEPPQGRGGALHIKLIEYPCPAAGFNGGFQTSLFALPLVGSAQPGMSRPGLCLNPWNRRPLELNRPVVVVANHRQVYAVALRIRAVVSGHLRQQQEAFHSLANVAV